LVCIVPAPLPLLHHYTDITTQMVMGSACKQNDTINVHPRATLLIKIHSNLFPQSLKIPPTPTPFRPTFPQAPPSHRGAAAKGVAGVEGARAAPGGKAGSVARGVATGLGAGNSNGRGNQSTAPPPKKMVGFEPGNESKKAQSEEKAGMDGASYACSPATFDLVGDFAKSIREA